MGRLFYGVSGLAIEFDDRTLSHLHLVINAKLRRGEAFFFSWRDDPSTGNGRSSIWLDSSIPLYFKFNHGNRHAINRDWLEELTLSANQSQGLQLTPEPVPVPPAAASRSGVAPARPGVASPQRAKV
jgi:hypothetical protein